MKLRIIKSAAVCMLAAAVLSACAAPLGTNRDIGTDCTAEVSFIDVGQGDAILAELPGGEIMLIDGGDNGHESELFDYLDEHGVYEIDYLIATHPHADHIGGLPETVEKYDIGSIYMPRAEHDSKTYERLLEAIDEKGLTITAARGGGQIFDSGSARAEFLAPNSSEYSDLNNYSAVVKLTVGKTAFLFCGDAEAESEAELLSMGYDLSAEVIKIGHHGSATSSSAELIDAVDPEYAVISCGENNKYGHPSTEVLEKLSDRDIKVLRTDTDGDIVIKTDGKSVTVID